MDIACYIGKVPDTVWAAIIASFLTLGGVYLTNIGNNKRLLEQLKHDATERARERQMSIRRDVYLKAAEAISNAYTTLMGLPQADLQSTTWKTNSNSISESLMKVHVVGSDDTVAAVSRFSSEYSKSLFKLCEKKMYLDHLKSSIDVLSSLMNKSSQERDKYLDFMKEYNIKGSSDQRLWETINANYEFECKQNKQYTDEYSQSSQKYGDLIIDLMKDCYDKVNAIGEFLVPALSAVRTEMDFPFDVNRYRLLMEEIRAEMEISLNDFISYIQSKKEE